MKFDVYNLKIHQNTGVWSKSTVFTSEQGFLFWRKKWKKLLSELDPKGVSFKTYKTYCYAQQKHKSPVWIENLAKNTIFCSKRRKLVFLEGLSFEEMYCTIFTNLVLYGYLCGFKAKFWAKRYSGLKNYHPGILGVEISQKYRKTHGNIGQYNWLLEKEIKWYREIWNVDTLRK